MDHKISFLLFIFLLLSCSTTKQNAVPEISILAGVNKGGIIENTDLEIVNNTEPDAFTGATKTGFNCGSHITIPLWRNSIETGIDAILDNQTFTFNDSFRNFYGDRNILTTQIRLPLSYNFKFFTNYSNSGLFELKLGVSLGVNLYYIDDKTVRLPIYELKYLSIGPLFGFNINPFRLNNGSNIGIYFEMMRAFQKVYSDIYNVGNMPGLCYMKFGIRFTIPFKK